MNEQYAPESIEPRFDRPEAISSELVERIVREKKPGIPYIVGIDGPPGTGKSTFAKVLAGSLHGKVKKVSVVTGDHYLNKRDTRLGDGTVGSAEQHYLFSMNSERLAQEVLEPLRETGVLQKAVEVLNLKNEDKPEYVTYDIDGDTVVIVEGIYLYKGETSDYFDLKVFFHISDDEVIRRGLERTLSADSDKPAAEIDEYKSRFTTRYLPGYKIYWDADLPGGKAHRLVETTEKGDRIAASSPLPGQN